MKIHELQNINPSSLAKCIGCTAPFAYQIIDGMRKLPIKHCAKVSKEFGIPIELLRPDIAAAFKIQDSAA